MLDCLFLPRPQYNVLVLLLLLVRKGIFVEKVQMVLNGYTTARYVKNVVVTIYHNVTNIVTLIVDLEATNFGFLL